MARASSAAKAAAIDLHAMGARVVSVFGPFASKTLILLPTDKAEALFPEPLALSGATAVTEAIAHELEDISNRAPDLAGSTLAATARSLALELDHPFNSATSKSMCARALMDALEQLRALMPAKEEGDDVDDLAARRAARRAGVAAAAHSARS